MLVQHPSARFGKKERASGPQLNATSASMSRLANVPVNAREVEDSSENILYNCLLHVSTWFTDWDNRSTSKGKIKCLGHKKLKRLLEKVSLVSFW